MGRTQRVGSIHIRPGNDELMAQLHPARKAFLGEENILATLGALNLPKTVDASQPLELQQARVLAEQVYEMDTDGRALESASVTPAGPDGGVVQSLVQRWNATLSRRLRDLWETDYSPEISYNFGYDVAAFMGDAAIWAEGKNGQYAEGAGGFVDSRMVDYTSNRLRGRPIETYNFLGPQVIMPQDYIDFQNKPVEAEWEKLMN